MVGRNLVAMSTSDETRIDDNYKTEIGGYNTNWALSLTERIPNSSDGFPPRAVDARPNLSDTHDVAHWDFTVLCYVHRDLKPKP